MGVTKLAFTICSNNYLAQAKTLADSLVQQNSDYKFVIGLVDEYCTEIDYDFFLPHEIIPIKAIGLYEFSELVKKYNIIELNTAVKATFFKYIFARFEHLDYTYYFDPDMMVFNNLNELDSEFKASNILLTPHILTPIPLDGSFPGENLFLNYGIYNLGFIGVKRNEDSFKFLDWWEERTLNQGFINVRKGFFVDQLWINLVPIFFKKVKVLSQFGYNTAPWNLHERKLFELREDGYYLSDASKLVFYHFSSYNYSIRDSITKYYYRYSFDNCPYLKPIYDLYHDKLIQNKIEQLSKIPCAYMNKEKIMTKRKNTSKLKQTIKLFLPPILFRIRAKIVVK